MGAFVGSVHVKSDDRDGVKVVLEKVSGETGIRFLLGPALDGWIGIYPADRGQDSEIGQRLAADLSHPIIQFMVYDDDILQYWYYRSGQLVDHFYSKPGYFDEEGDELKAQRALKGKPAVFRDFIGDEVSKLRKALARKRGQFTFESERLAKVAEILKIPNTSAGYEDLKAGESYEIKEWEKFEEIPAAAVANEKKKRKSERDSTRGEWEQLKTNESLLVLDQRFEKVPSGCLLNDGYFVAWVDYRNDTAELEQCIRPWQRSTSLAIDAPNVIRLVTSDPLGKWIAIGGFQQVRVWETQGESWSVSSDIDESDLAHFGSISMSGRFLLHGTRENVYVNDLVGRQLIDFWPVLSHRCSAIHPNDEWAMLGGRQLQLIPVNGDPISIEFDVGTELPLDSASVKKLLSVDLNQLNNSLRKIISHEIEAIQNRGSDKSGKSHSTSKMNLIRTGKEKKLEVGLTRLKAMQEGNIPAYRLSPENVTTMGFSRDGKWFWCGTNLATCVYAWTAIPREPGEPLPKPSWRFECFDFINSIVEEMGGSAIVFGSSKGTIYRMNLETGDVKILFQLPGRTSVRQLIFSKSGHELGIVGYEYETSVYRFGKQGPQSTWCIFSYSELKRGMTPVTSSERNS